MTINSTTRKTSNLAGNGNTHTYPFAFKVFTDADVVVKKLEISTSIETTLTLGANNDYIVTLNSDQNGNPGGSITLKSGGNNFNLPSGFQLVITSAVEPLQGTDLTNQGGFYPEVINDALDQAVILHQQQQDELDRSIKFSLTNTIGSLEITENANARKNRVLGFDNLGEFEVLKELGTYRGNWAASTSYAVRDLVKDTSTNNIFFCNTAHTSQGAQPLTTNTNSANWDLIVDAASSTTAQNNAAASATASANSATAAASSQTAAANSATAAATSETNASNSATTASTKATQADASKTAAQTAQAAAELALDTFDDRYLGAKQSDPATDNDGNALIDGALYYNTTSNITKVYDLGTTSWLVVNITGTDLTNTNTVAGAISNVNTVGSSISNVNAVASNSSNINAVAGNSSNINTVAAANTNVNSVAGNIANVNTVASNISNVNTVAADIAKVVTVANDLNETVSEIETAAADLQETTSEIDTVANAITNVNLVGNNISNINAIGTILAGQTTYAVTVANGVFYIDGVANPTLSIIRGFTYIFDQSNNSNAGHPLAFKDGSGNAYTTGVTVNGTAGQSNANVTFVVPSNAPASMRYYCTQHGNGMGNTITVGDDNIGVVASDINNVNTVAGSITNVNNVGGSIANVNSVASNLSGVNAFAERYRTDNSGNNPSSNNDGGDLFFNQASGKLLVYNANTSAWEETQSVGNFFINTISQFSGTGGNSATFNGVAYKFTLSNAGQFAQQMLVSVAGVVQKPNTGTGQPSEGFALDGANIIFAAPPPAGADYFIVTIGASVSIGTPSDGTITEAKLNASNNPVNGYFLQAQSGAAGGLTWAAVDLTNLSASNLTSGTLPNARFPATLPAVSGANLTNLPAGNLTGTVADARITTLTASKLTGALPAIDGSNLTGISTDLVGDTSPQLGGDLQSNGNDIDFADNDKARFGASADLEIYHNGTDNYIVNNAGHFRILNAASNKAIVFSTSNTNRFQISDGGHLIPSANNSYDLGDTNYRWRNVYTNDLNLSNEGSSNDVDGTWGSYTIQEGAEDLFLVNKRNGKKYKFNLTEVT